MSNGFGDPGMPLPEGYTVQSLMEEFREFIKDKIESEKYEAYSQLAPKDAKEWDSIQDQFGKLENKLEELRAKRRLFWAKLERKLGIFDKEMKIEDHVLYIEKDSKKEK